MSPLRSAGNILATVLFQFLGFALSTYLVEKYEIGQFMALTVDAISSALLANFVLRSKTWICVNLSLPFFFFLGLNIPPSILFGFLIVSLLLYAPAFFGGVPLYLTNRQSYEQINKLLPTGGISRRFADLGSGFGGLLFYLARKDSGGGSFTGYELSLLPYLFSKTRALLFSRRQVRVYFKSFWSAQLSDHDVIYAFLAEPPMARLEEKLLNEAKPGTVFISNTFPLPNRSADAVIKQKANGRNIYLYQF